jgi:hypothetical protein
MLSIDTQIAEHLFSYLGSVDFNNLYRTGSSKIKYLLQQTIKTYISIKEFKEVAFYPKITYIHISGTKVDHWLERERISGLNFDDEWFELLSSLALTTLIIDDPINIVSLKWIPRTITKLNINHLMKNEGVQFICENCPNLKSLDISESNSAGPGIFQFLPNELQEFNYSYDIDLTAEHLSALPDGLLKFCSDCYFIENCWHNLPSNITYLNIERADLSAKEILSLPRTITALNLISTELDKEKCENLPPSLKILATSSYFGNWGSFNCLPRQLTHFETDYISTPFEATGVTSFEGIPPNLIYLSLDRCDVPTPELKKLPLTLQTMFLGGSQTVDLDLLPISVTEISTNKIIGTRGPHIKYLKAYGECDAFIYNPENRKIQLSYFD